MKKIFVITTLLINLLLIQAMAVAHAATATASLWEALKQPNHFALIRHAIAPGGGDPSDFTLWERDTQRNLSDEGRSQAKQIGELFRTNGIKKAKVVSSQWYRCSDTAELIDIGPVTTLPFLNSFYERYEEEAEKTRGLSNWLQQQPIDKPLVVVTHYVNIASLVDFYPDSGEIVVVEKRSNKQFKVLGSIKTKN